MLYFERPCKGVFTVPVLLNFMCIEVIDICCLTTSQSEKGEII